METVDARHASLVAEVHETVAQLLDAKTDETEKSSTPKLRPTQLSCAPPVRGMFR
jgi:hypothetical protein